MKELMTLNDKYVLDNTTDEWQTSQKIGKTVKLTDGAIKKILFKLCALKYVELSYEKTNQSSTGYKYLWRRLK